MADLSRIRENSLTYNGPRSKITATAEAMVLVGTKALDEVGGGLVAVVTNMLVNIAGSGVDWSAG